VTVKTDKGEYQAEKLIITAGPWAPRLMMELDVPMRVTRQAMAWLWPKQPELFAMGRFPSWAMDLAPRDQFRGVQYGFPMTPPALGNPGFKAALHWPDEACDPNTVDRTVRDSDTTELRTAIDRYLPAAAGPLLAARICLYTNSPDGHFIVDQHPAPYPGAERVHLACGFSGHGFKFVSVMGESLADLAMHGKTNNPIDFLRLNRFAKRG
jgi:sarcosine oxidase